MTELEVSFVSHFNIARGLYVFGRLVVSHSGSFDTRWCVSNVSRFDMSRVQAHWVDPWSSATKRTAKNQLARPMVGLLSSIGMRSCYDLHVLQHYELAL